MVFLTTEEHEDKGYGMKMQVISFYINKNFAWRRVNL